MAGGTAIRDRFEALASVQDTLLTRRRSRGFALLTALASLDAEGTPDAVWETAFAHASAIRREVKWYSHMRGHIRFPISGLLAGTGRCPNDFMDYRRVGRAAFKTHKVHCRDHEEGTLALLQMYLVDKDPAHLDGLTERFQALYRVLKENHWLSVDTRFYPIIAFTLLQVTATTPILTRWTGFAEELRRRRLRTRRQQYQAALVLAETDHDPVETVEELCRLDRAIRQEGLRTRHVNLTDLAFLRRTGLPPQEIARAWCAHLTALRKGPLALDRQEATRAGVTLLLHEFIRDDALRRDLTGAKTITDILRVVFAIRRERSTTDSGDSWGHADDWPDTGDGG